MIRIVGTYPPVCATSGIYNKLCPKTQYYCVNPPVHQAGARLDGAKKTAEPAPGVGDTPLLCEKNGAEMKIIDFIAGRLETYGKIHRKRDVRASHGQGISFDSRKSWDFNRQPAFVATRDT